MLLAASPFTTPARRRVAAIVFAIALFVAYRQFWDDISSAVPYSAWTSAEYGGSWTRGAKKRPDPPSWSPIPLKDGNPDRLPLANEYVASIMSAQPGSQLKMQCPSYNRTRYTALRPSSSMPASSGRKYFFALDLRQIVHLLPTLMGSIVEAMTLLGPEKCALSIVEGLSGDGTFEVLRVLQREMDKLGVDYHLQTSSINSHWGDRIGKLSKLRNLALEPMMANATSWDHDATILFINDVAICTEDILELLYQKRLQGADMACAMDYHRLHSGPDSRLAFYDVWISRSMDGNSFFEVPSQGDWSLAWNMFPHDDVARAKYQARRPFQVFSCWNGATSISAAPFLDGRLQFRRAAKDKGECGAGEPTLLCKDMWNLGYSKIMVVPSVSLGYDVEEGSLVKKAKGFTSSWTGSEDDGGVAPKVEWKSSPPDMVRCIPSWRTQFWRKWNHSLSEPPTLRGNDDERVASARTSPS